MEPIQNFIAGKWQSGQNRSEISNTDPSTGNPLQSWNSATPEQVTQAVSAARTALPDWNARPAREREKILQRFAEVATDRADELASAIQREAGKPRWEALQEAKAVSGKIALSIEAYSQRCHAFGQAPSHTRFKPHGVLGVLGPFNFPAHLPNGHIAPALLAGNTLVFKPSERVPSAGQLMARFWDEAGLPAGVLNLLQGDGATGAALADHPFIDGLLFTGGSKLGEQLRQSFARQPEKILALELGGNNPLIAWEVEDPVAAATLILQSAYVTAGQRCTCARRLIVPDGNDGDQLIESVLASLDALRSGSAWEVPEVFMGPVISSDTARGLEEKQSNLLERGAEALRPLKAVNGETGIVTPGLIDATPLPQLDDEEIFGPLLLVRRAKTFDDALAEANRTRYGLASGLLSDRKDRYEAFYRSARSGIINWNTPLTGASGAAPFGGTGLSGNHRPSGFFAADYCSYPVASLERERLEQPANLPPGLRLVPHASA